MNIYSRVGIKGLTDARLDANYYAPRFLENETILAQCGISRSKVIELADLCNCGATPVDVVYSNEGVGLVRTSDVRPNHFKAKEILKTNDLDLSELRESVIARPGDLLYTMSGTIGYACVIPDEELPVSFSNTIARVRLPRPSSNDAHYIAVFFNCHYGYEQSLRLVSGGIQGHVMPNPFKELLVVLPNSVAQKYIGDKVRQAERLRAWAKALEAGFESSLKKAVPDAFENRSTGKKYSRALVEDISYTLNPGAFDEERLRVQHYLLKLGGERFGKLADISGPTTSRYKADATYIGLDAISSGSCQLAPSTVQEAEISGACRLLVEGPVIAKLRPYLNKVSYIPKRLAGAIGSTELLCITPLGRYSGWYLYGVLKSELTLKQLRPLATGATHPRIDKYDVYDLVVPVLDDQEILGQSLELAQAAYFLATELTAAAKYLVEALIEGQLTEAELIAAEQALQAGNDQLDRRILNRLKTDGIDGQGAARFGDLDELYSLLTQAEVDR